MNITESTKGVTTTEGNEEECSHMDKVDITAQAEEELPGSQCTKTMSVTLDLDQQCDEQIDSSLSNQIRV